MRSSLEPPRSTLQAESRYGELGLSGLEIASGIALGRPQPLSLPGGGADPLAALEDVLRDALLRPPCVIGFSGGRDSSVLLAVAARVAGREGLEPPLPVTQTFPHLPETDEGEWQEVVVRHIGVQDWVRIAHRDELDIIGPLARPVLERFGPMYPMNAHFVLPLIERTAGGTVVTGLDGDTLLGGWRWRRVGDVLARRERARPRDALRVAHRLAPLSLQRARLVRDGSRYAAPWLSAGAAARFRELVTDSLGLHPRRFDRYVVWLAGARYLGLVCAQLDLLAGGSQAAMAHPFLDPRFLGALARWGGVHGRGSRTEVLRSLFGGVLPERLLTRESKARFDRAYLASHTRAFAAEWDGTGLDPELVDVTAFREELARPGPRTGIASLVQWLWLNRRERSSA